MMIIYGSGHTYLPLSIVYVAPYNEAYDILAINPDISDDRRHGYGLKTHADGVTTEFCYYKNGIKIYFRCLAGKQLNKQMIAD